MPRWRHIEGWQPIAENGVVPMTKIKSAAARDQPYPAKPRPLWAPVSGLYETPLIM